MNSTNKRQSPSDPGSFASQAPNSEIPDFPDLETIEINARHYLLGKNNTFDVIDRALELQMLPDMVFANGTEQECREWVLRNYEEPKGHCFLTVGPALLALVEQYHKSFPTKESGKLIAQAKGWI